MPTWGPTDCGAAAATTSSGLGAGLGPHCPVGTWSGTKYRSGLRWQPPSGWSSWVGITSATLKVKTTDFAHVGPRNSSIYAKRTGTQAGAQWVEGSGTQNCNSGFSSSNATQYDDLSPSSTNAAQFQSGTAENKWLSIDVTALIRDYWNARGVIDNITIVLDGQDSTDYAEFWSNDSSGNEPNLTIVYSDAAPPLAPKLISPDPTGINVPMVRPTFTWAHQATGGDPQTAADVVVQQGATVLTTLHPTTPTGQSAVCDVDLPRGVAIDWKVRTSDVSGFGPYSSGGQLAVTPLPVVTLGARAEEWGPALVLNAPVVPAAAPAGVRLRVNWSLGSTAQQKYRVTTAASGPYAATDSGWITDTVAHTYLIPLALVDNSPVSVTVTVDGSINVADGLTAAATASFNPRFSLSTHKYDLTQVPTTWVSAVWQEVLPMPAGASIHVDYATTATVGAAAPTVWKDQIGDVSKNQFVWYRVFLIPGPTAGPALDSIVISSQQAPPEDVDKWSTDKASHLLAPFVADRDQYVYGSKSVRIDVAVPSANGYVLYSDEMTLRDGRSYILTGLMRSIGNSGAHFRLEDSVSGLVLKGSTPQAPTTLVDMISEIITGDRKFYETGTQDVVRYATPVFAADGDTKVRVVLAAGKTGAGAGSQAWFDALKLEESTVATPWSPGAVGAVIVDAGGVQVDARPGKNGVFRLRGSDASDVRAVVGIGDHGLLFAGDTVLSSPATGILNVNGQPIGGSSVELLRYVPTGVIAVVPGTTYTATTAQLHTPSITSIPPEAVAVAVQIIANANVISPGDRYEIMDYNGSGYRAQGFSGKVASHYEALSSHYVVLGGDRQFDYKVTVGTAGNHLIIVNVLGYWLKEMSGAIAVGGGGVIGAGAVFPASPVPDHRFYRTDIDMEFHWDGTQWLCNCPHYVPTAGGPRGATPTAASAAANYWTPLIPPNGCSDIWVEAVDYFYQVGNAAAWNATNFWTHSVIKFIEGGASAIIDAASPNGLSTNLPHAFRRQINALFGVPAGYVGWRVDYTKQGAPDVLYAGAAMQVRYVAT